MFLKYPVGLLLIISTLGGCASSTYRKNREILKDRFEKLESLSRFPAKTCTVEARLSEPMKQRYLAQYPDEKALLKKGAWPFSWSVSEYGCKVTIGKPSEMQKSHLAILNGAFCTLLQPHFVNSPFDGLQVKDQQIEDQPENVFIRVNEKAGIAIGKTDFLIETQTANLGNFKAHYQQGQRDFLPDWLEMNMPNSRLRIDQITYSEPTLARTPLQSFWISVGEQEVVAHTFVNVLSCTD